MNIYFFEVSDRSVFTIKNRIELPKSGVLHIGEHNL